MDYDYNTGDSTYHERVFTVGYAIDCPKEYNGLLFQLSGSSKEDALANAKLDYSQNAVTTLDMTPYKPGDCIYIEPVRHAAAD